MQAIKETSSVLFTEMDMSIFVFLSIKKSEGLKSVPAPEPWKDFPVLHLIRDSDFLRNIGKFRDSE